MWTIISEVLLKIVMYVISDKVLIQGAKTMIVKAVDSATKGVGVTDTDVQEVINRMTKSTLNTLEDTFVK